MEFNDQCTLERNKQIIMADKLTFNKYEQTHF